MDSMIQQAEPEFVNW